MANFDRFLDQLSVTHRYRNHFKDIFKKYPLATQVNILVVVDTNISTQPNIGFGINRVIDIIRSTSVGCMSFNVDIGERSGGAPTIVALPAGFDPKYTGFRFDMKDSDGVTPVLNRYQQVWCFGFKPDNNAGPDTNITQASAFPATDSELAVLSKWMDDRKGGVFATGDHDYLGASMCHRIPRVRTMRRWTNADGVPPIGGLFDADTADRIDTLRPQTVDGSDTMSNDTHQGDTIPQPIQWVAWSTVNLTWYKRVARPHPVLCHPSLGPIDVMPDHAHEGLCVDTPNVNIGGSYNFDGTGNKPEYPLSTSGQQTRPTVIAYGSTLASPPYHFGKGPQPYRAKFPMISVYDGHVAKIGRVAVDSTWHHWMNINIVNLESAGGNNWEKIKQYFINLAVWLCPPGYTTKCFLDHVVLSQFGYAGAQEYSLKLSNIELGRALRNQLTLYFGPCWVTQYVFDKVFEIDPKLAFNLFDRFVPRFDPQRPWPPIPDPCLTCPPLDLFEDAVLGGIVRATLKDTAEIRQQADNDKITRDLSLEVARRSADEGVRSGLADVREFWQKSLKETQDFLKLLP